MMKKVVIVFVMLIGLTGLAYVLYPNAHDEARVMTSAHIGDTKAPTFATLLDDSDRRLDLSAQNTTVSFSCAKTVAGKTLVVRGGWSGKFDSEIEGTLGIDASTSRPRWLDAKARIDSLWSEHDQLTEALLTAGFFRPEQHPWATFQGGFIDKPADDATDEAAKDTTVVSGEFTLNGITKHIEFPVTIEHTENLLIVSSEFSLDRHAFDVELKEEGILGLLLTNEDIADNVAVRLRIEVPLDAAESSDTVVENTSATNGNETTSTDTTIDTTDWPESFTETIPTTQVQFDMALVPAEPDSNSQAFYIGKHEVTWDEFMPWVQGNDLEDEAEVGEERALKLRPSSPYGTVDRNFGMYRRPALGMSRLSAELYCKWLSKQTGRTYRLPTEAEWERVVTAGGGELSPPASTEQADRVATYTDNAWDDDIGDWATTQIGKREPNSLGIYDLAGNVAEWVTGTGDERVVRGGHFESPLNELIVGRIVEDQDEWNRDYPNEPKSQWWYVNARWVGFRVVCEMPPNENTGLD